jgi:hypothetical protein
MGRSKHSGGNWKDEPKRASERRGEERTISEDVENLVRSVKGALRAGKAMIKAREAKTRENIAEETGMVGKKYKKKKK